MERLSAGGVHTAIMRIVASKKTVVLFLGSFLLMVTALGCKTHRPPAAASGATVPSVVQATGADEQEDDNPANDRVLGMWNAVGAEEDFEEQRTCKLWPVEASDKRAVKVLRFFNDSMVSNGCCAASEWLRIEPRFYTVRRGDDVSGFDELFYLDERSETLYLVARCEQKESEAAFKQAIAAFRAKGEMGTNDFPARYKRTNEIKRF